MQQRGRDASPGMTTPDAPAIHGERTVHTTSFGEGDWPDAGIRNRLERRQAGPTGAHHPLYKGFRVSTGTDCTGDETMAEKRIRPA